MHRYPISDRYYFLDNILKNSSTCKENNFMVNGYINRSCVDRLGVLEGSWIVIIIIKILQQKNKTMLWIVFLSNLLALGY